LESGVLVFVEGGKLDNLEKKRKTLRAQQEPTTNSPAIPLLTLFFPTLRGQAIINITLKFMLKIKNKLL